MKIFFSLIIPGPYIKSMNFGIRIIISIGMRIMTFFFSVILPGPHIESITFDINTKPIDNRNIPVTVASLLSLNAKRS